MVAYKSLKTKENGVSQRWSYVELVAYESGHKESFDCRNKNSSILHLRKSWSSRTRYWTWSEASCISHGYSLAEEFKQIKSILFSRTLR